MRHGTARGLAWLALVAILGGCASYTLVKPKRHEIAGTYSVETRIAWNKASSGPIELWTVDGPRLESIQFWKGLKDGKPLFEPKRGANKKPPPPAFAAAMTANDVMELVVDSLSRAGAAKINASNLRPFDFGSEPGFRFDLAGVNKDGLEINGLASGAIIDKKLYLVLYSGARANYLPKYRKEAEHIMGSIEVL